MLFRKNGKNNITKICYALLFARSRVDGKGGEEKLKNTVKHI